LCDAPAAFCENAYENTATRSTALADVELGARLRYEITRNITPYIGVNWERKLGETASIARAKGDPIDNRSSSEASAFFGKRKRRRIPAASCEKTTDLPCHGLVIGPAATCGGA
jgi:hypothetical protein